MTVLTEEAGKIDMIAKGSRKGASRLGSISEPLSVAVLQVAEGKNRRFVTQAQPLRSFPGLRRDYARLTYALSLAELIATTGPFEQPIDGLFLRAVGWLQAIEEHPKPLVALVWAQSRLMTESGFFPCLSECVVSGAKLSEAEPFLSPQAGGYVTHLHSNAFNDRFLTTAEVIYGLDRIAELDQPPDNLKFAEYCFRALVPFWRAIAESSLPATEAVANGLYDIAD